MLSCFILESRSNSMKGVLYSRLKNRGIIRVSGSDSYTFLQNLITNDMSKVTNNNAIFAALLTPQGKFLHEFMIVKGNNGEFLIDCESNRLNDLGQRLINYRLRANIQVSDMRDEIEIYALTEDLDSKKTVISANTLEMPYGAIRFTDPRDNALGLRVMLPIDTGENSLKSLNYAPAHHLDYEKNRLKLGIPEGSKDFDVEKSTLAEIGFERLNGVDFSKGCYIGQEVTTRMKQRGTARKKLLVVKVFGNPPPPGTPIYAGDKEVGQIKSSCGNLAIAIVQRNYLELEKSTPLKTNNLTVIPYTYTSFLHNE